jgi:hypothetical protein
MLLASFAGCGSFGPGDALPDAPEGGAPDANVPVESGPPAEGSTADGATDCAYDCTPGACVNKQCQPFAVTKVGFSIYGIAAATATVFFTVPTQNTIFSSPIAPDSKATALHSGLTGLGAIEVRGASELTFARSADQLGLFTAMGASIAQVSNGPLPCRGFASLPGKLFFCASATPPSTSIAREHAPDLAGSYFLSPEAVSFLDANDTTVFWADATTLRKGPTSGGQSDSAGAVVLTGRQPIGIALRDGWLYFTETNGTVARVKPNGEQLTDIWKPTTAPAQIGDIAVTPDGMKAFWAQGNTIQGIALPP